MWLLSHDTRFKPASVWFQNHACNHDIIQLRVWNACIIHVTNWFSKCNHLLPLASWGHEYTIFMLSPAALCTPGLYSLTVFLMTGVALFYYITDPKTLRILDSNKYDITSSDPQAEKVRTSDLFSFKSIFLPTLKGKHPLHSYCCFILVPKVPKVPDPENESNCLRKRKGGLRRQEDYTESGTQWYMFGKKDIMCL